MIQSLSEINLEKPLDRFDEIGGGRLAHTFKEVLQSQEDIGVLHSASTVWLTQIISVDDWSERDGDFDEYVVQWSVCTH